jgi:hypothetical protein
MDFGTLIGQFAANQKGYKFHPRQIETAQAVYAEAIDQGIDPRFALAVTWQETKLGGNGKKPIFKSAINNDKGRGHAYGFMQVLEGTAAEMGLGNEFRQMKEQYETKGVADPETSAKLGVSYLKRLVERNGFENISQVAAGYYGGPGAAKRKFTNQITDYVSSVANHMGKFGETPDQVSWKQPAAFDNTVIAGSQTPTAGPTLMQRAKEFLAPENKSIPPSITAPMASAPRFGPQVAQAAQVAQDGFSIPQISQAASRELTNDDWLRAMGIGMDTASERAIRQEEPLIQLSYGGRQKEPIDQLRNELNSMYDDLQQEGSFG